MGIEASTALWTVDEIIAAVAGAAEGEGRHEISSVSIDSRTLEPGALYVAIKGVAQDGHAYVTAAFKAGAVAALVRSNYERQPGDGLLIRVEDTLSGLEMLGAAARARTQAKVIGVTGSAGKTGTKEALKTMLSRSGLVHASVKSFNNHWGVPLSLARMPRETDYAVFEVGMNHAGEIEPLSKMIQPDAALITTVAPVHIGHFNSEGEIADAKAEIFAGLKPGGVALLPGDNPHIERLIMRANEAGVSNVRCFGKNQMCDFRLIEIDCAPQGSSGRYQIDGEIHNFTLKIPGEPIALNMLGALAAISAVGADLQNALSSLVQLAPPPGRGDIIKLACEGGEIMLIDESYNANPASMSFALNNLAVQKGEGVNRRIAILGDMLELGEGSKGYHRVLSSVINDLDIDVVFSAGPMMETMFEGLVAEKRGMHAENVEEIEEKVVASVQPGDVVLVKGSQLSNMALIISALKDKLRAN